MGWIEDEVDVLVVEVEDEVDREGLGSSSPRFMPLRVSGPGYGRCKPFSRASHFPTILPGFTYPPVLLGEPYSYRSAAKASETLCCGWFSGLYFMSSGGSSPPGPKRTRA